MTMYRQLCNTQIKQYQIDSDLDLKCDATPRKAIKETFKAENMKRQGRNWIYLSKKFVDNKNPEALTEPVGLIYEERLNLLTS